MVSEDFLKEYVEEVKEHLQELESSLLFLEREGTDEIEINKIFRAAHSIKGASAYMGFERLAHLTHEMESLFGKIQTQSLPVTPKGISVLLECVDFISGALGHLQEKGEELPLPESLLEKLGRLFSPEDASEKEDEKAPASLPEITVTVGIDLESEHGLEEERAEGTVSKDELGLSIEGESEESEQIDEEDQELLEIFLKASQENIMELQALFVAHAKDPLPEADFENAHDRIKKLVTSSQYMDYQGIANLFKDWERSLLESHEVKPARPGAFYLEQLGACVRSLREVLPRFSMPALMEAPESAPSMVEEEDQELFSIFVDSLQQRFSELVSLTPAFPEATLTERDVEYARELIHRLISSSQYMDYDPVVDLLKEWEKSLQDSDSVLDGRRYSTLLTSGAQRLQDLVPGLQLSVALRFAGQPQQIEEPLDEEDEELLGIFLESFREHHNHLMKLPSSPPETCLTGEDVEQFRELIDRLISSSQYMGYDNIMNASVDWKRALLEAHENGQATWRRYSELLAGCSERLQEMLPGLQLTCVALPAGKKVEKEELLQEEDEELLTIFLDSFRELFSSLIKIAPLTPELGIGEDDFLSARGLIRRMISSSQYMGYDSLVSCLEETEKELLEAYESDKCSGALYSDILCRSAESLRKAMPRLQLAVEFPYSQKPFGDDLDREIDASFDFIEQLVPDFVDSGLTDDVEKHLSATGPEDAAPVEAVPEEPSEVPSRKERKKAARRSRASSASEESPSSIMLRVDAEKVDNLLNQVGELVVTRSEFIQTAVFLRDIMRELSSMGRLTKQELRKLRSLSFRLNESTLSLGRVANDLQASAMRIRMLPVSQLFQRFPRVVRDQALKMGKHVELVVEGGETEIDKRVLDQMNDPLVQFLRNAIAHGIESPEERKAAGKPARGTIRLAAYQEGDHVVLEVEDDGRGVDTFRLRNILRSRKEMTLQELERVTDQELVYAIFLPGISTRERVDGTAGRGVGLDVVKENVDRMNGVIEVDSQPGVGTRFIIRIPLTVAIIRALLVWGADQIFTIPLSTVSEILRYDSEDTHTIEGFQVINLRGKTVPLVHLDHMLNLNGSNDSDDRKFIVIVNTRFREVGIVVDGLMGEREVVIKPIEDDYQAFEGFSGATILGDGSISLILDVSSILRKAKDMSHMHGMHPYTNVSYLH